MASPTEGEMDNQLRAGVLLIDNFLAQQTVPADEDAYNQIVESDFAAAQSSGARAFRSRVSIGVTTTQPVLSPILTAYTHHIVNKPERTAQAAIDRIYDYFVANNKTVLSRGITYGAIPSFGTGKGTVYRLTEDENGYSLEAEFVETKTLKVLNDENTGAERFREVFEFAGGNAGVDALDSDSSGALRRDVLAKDSSSSLLQNPSFSQFSIAGSFTAGRYVLTALDTVEGWTMNAAVGFALDRNEFARNIVGDTNPTSLVALTGGLRSITQAFSVNRLSLSPAFPHLPIFWIRGGSTLTAGSVTITWGSQSEVFALSAADQDTWRELAIARDSKIWPATFNAEDADIVFSVTGHDDDVFIDENFFGPMEPFDGTWWHPSGSIASKFLLDDQIQVADVFAGSDSKIQKWFWRAYARHLPHVPAATQVVASGGRTLTFADVNPDTITASSGSFVSDGYLAGQQLTVTGTTLNDGTYTLATVAATVLTLILSDTLVAEGPLSGGETLDAGPSVTDP